MRSQRRKKNRLEERVAALEMQLQEQQLYLEILVEFCSSVAHKEGLGTLSYQQLNSPTPESAENVRTLVQKILKTRKHQ